MSAYDLLSNPIKTYVRHQGWSQFTDIQNAAIIRITETKNNYILSARTASGKTEAAFLPILSLVDWNTKGLKVLYISPLVALINDQFNRVEKLAEYLNVPVTKWHGEAKRSKKAKLIKKPSGILLITPESIEALFVNRAHEAKILFENLDFVVIDEIHVFVNSNRGCHLRSLLNRIQNDYCKNQVRYIGLSATLGSHLEDVKNYFNSKQPTKILVDNSKQPRNTEIHFFKKETPNLPLELIDLVYKKTYNKKTLIFPNSRGIVEEVAIRLKKKSKSNNGHQNYFSHHSSIDKKLREHIEHFVKKKNAENFSIACTSTLELGIDIGSVDQVVQISSTHSVASLSQRLGRSGRKKGESSNLLFCATDEWDLIQSIACNELLTEGYIEDLKFRKYPIDILTHQILSHLVESNGLQKQSLVSKIRLNQVFATITDDELKELVNHLIEIDVIEYVNRELIVGFEGEKLIHRRSFYAMFESSQDFKVISGSKILGELPLSIQIQIDSNIYLAARIWKIKDIDFESKKIFVVPASDGKKPIFAGGSGNISKKIHDKMIEVVSSNCSLNDITKSVEPVIRDFRKSFSVFGIKDFEFERPVFVENETLKFFSFGGTQINKTLLAFYSIYLDPNVDLRSHAIIMKCSLKSLLEANNTILKNYKNCLERLNAEIETKADKLNPTKWSEFLPLSQRVKLTSELEYDFEGTLEFLRGLVIKK